MKVSSLKRVSLKNNCEITAELQLPLFPQVFRLLYNGVLGVLFSAMETVMGRTCQLTGKKANNAYAVSHSHRRTKKVQEVNLQWKRIWWEQGKRWVRLRLSTKAIKTLELKSLDVFAKEAGINLNRL